MENYLDGVVGRAGKVIRYWWLLLLSGLFVAAVGVAVFCFPAESYITLGLLFGVMMLVTGVAQLVTSVTSRNYFMLRGYTVIGGILDLLLGIFLCCYPGITLVILPVILGVWMLYHSFMIIGFAADLSSFRIKGSGWVVAAGVLLLLMSLLVLLLPFTVGVATVVALTGAGLLLFGILVVIISLKFRKIHNYFKYEDAKIVG